MTTPTTRGVVLMGRAAGHCLASNDPEVRAAGVVLNALALAIADTPASPTRVGSEAIWLCELMSNNLRNQYSRAERFRANIDQETP